MRPYFLIAALYLLLAGLEVAASVLSGMGLLPALGGTRWFRVHLITLGVLAEVVFAVLPALSASRAGRRASMHWDQWILLNAGLVMLIAGIPMINATLIIGGGTLIFAAVLRLLRTLIVTEKSSRQAGLSRPLLPAHGGRLFYLLGLVFLLIGILAGTGLWFGWDRALAIVEPKEVHVHSNLWGFTALVFAGLLVDLYPEVTGRSLAWERAVPVMGWTMGLGALGMVAGPWTGINLFTVVGLGLHTVATLWLLLSAVRPLWGKRGAWTPGLLHLLTSYLWFLVPVIAAPLIVFRAGGVANEIAGSGGPVLIYGWILQFLYALLPYLFRRALLPKETARLGGSWFTLVTVQAGSFSFWFSLLIPDLQPVLRSLAYALWFISMLPVAWELWAIIRAGMQNVEDQGRGELPEWNASIE